MIQEYFKEFLSFHPLFASTIGYSEYDGILMNYYSKEYSNSLRKFYIRYLKRLQTWKRKTIYHHILQYYLEKSLEYKKFPFHYLVLSKDGTIFQRIHSMVNHETIPLRSDNDLKNVISRYKKSISIIQTQEIVLREGIRKKITVPKLIVRIAIEQLKTLEKKKFLLPKKEKNFNKDLIEDYRNMIRLEVRPEIIRFRKFLETVYLPDSRNSIGLCSLPNGKNMYKFLVRKKSTLDDITIHEIVLFGRREIKRLEKEMNILMREIGYRYSLPSFLKKIYSNKKFFYSNGKEIIHAFRQWRSKIQKTVIPQYFDFKVSMDYEIREMPKQRAKYGTGAYYTLPTREKKGCFYINTFHKDSNPSFSLESLLLHEGNPGHNFQNMRAIDLKIPEFIIYLHESGPSEGWALYAETLGEYKDKYSRFGKLLHEMLRAVRLILDTGIHFYGWSFQKSVSFLRKKTGISEFDAKNEIIRYISNPGQAVTYKLGERFILSLRDKFLREKKGTLKDFHSFLLNKGPIPFKFI